MLTIIMYHYVRDLPRTRYPSMTGLLTSKFEGQLNYIAKHYTVCGINEVVAAMRGEVELPPNACVLTFDDGFIDHYVTVFPMLEERGMVGCFYPPAKAVEESRLLDTHKVHFVLAATPDHHQVVQDFFKLAKPYRKMHDFPEDEELYKTLAVPGPDGDPPDTNFLKRTQHTLPEEVRIGVLNKLFDRYVNVDEETLAKEHYMDIAQIRTMARHGMEIGGHGYRHVNLSHLSPEEQQEEIIRNADFLEKIYGHRPKNWVMSYPFGKYDQTTIKLLKESGCALALGIIVDLVSDLSDPYHLNRLDTNNIPFSGEAEISDWTLKAQETRTNTRASNAN